MLSADQHRFFLKKKNVPTLLFITYSKICDAGIPDKKEHS